MVMPIHFVLLHSEYLCAHERERDKGKARLKEGRKKGKSVLDGLSNVAACVTGTSVV